MSDRKCSKCKLTLPIENFGSNRQRKDGISLWCKKCNRDSIAKIRSTQDGAKKHRDRENARYKKNRETALVRAKDYYSKNRDWLKEKNLEAGRKRYAGSQEHRDKEKLRGQIWAKNNRARVQARSNANRLRRMRATPSWLSRIQKAQIQEFYEIAAARNMQTGVKHHVDHIFAIKGQGWRGLHVPWNLQVMTQAENDAKWIKVPKEFEHFLWNPQKHLRSGF
jgi:5-methylcytosine-specific restriction endonuclease McrA